MNIMILLKCCRLMRLLLCQVRDVIAYAAKRFIEVVPEIELPGHCCAALASYPYLGCTGSVTQVPTHWGIHEDIYCAVRCLIPVWIFYL